MDDWILNRLSPVKDSDPRWTGLAKAIQQFWEENFDPLHYDLVDLRSIYTMSQSDLALKMREKGDYFSPDWPTEYDQPLAVAWREGEVLRKSTEYILKSTFRRNFRGVNVDWLPLYAPKVGDYGSLFVTAGSVIGQGETIEDDYWLTSRGVVSVDLNSMYSAGSWAKSEFSPIVSRIVKKLKPTHIVFDGVIFQWNAEDNIDIHTTPGDVGTDVSIQFDIGFIKRYDITRADVETTDLEDTGLTLTTLTDTTVNSFVGVERFGPFFDELALDWTMLDWNFFNAYDDTLCITTDTITEAPFIVNSKFLIIK